MVRKEHVQFRTWHNEAQLMGPLQYERAMLVGRDLWKYHDKARKLDDETRRHVWTAANTARALQALPKYEVQIARPDHTMIPSCGKAGVCACSSLNAAALGQSCIL